MKPRTDAEKAALLKSTFQKLIIGTALESEGTLNELVKTYGETPATSETYLGNISRFVMRETRKQNNLGCTQERYSKILANLEGAVFHIMELTPDDGYVAQRQLTHLAAELFYALEPHTNNVDLADMLTQNAISFVELIGLSSISPQTNYYAAKKLGVTRLYMATKEAALALRFYREAIAYKNNDPRLFEMDQVDELLSKLESCMHLIPKNLWDLSHQVKEKALEVKTHLQHVPARKMKPHEALTKYQEKQIQNALNEDREPNYEAIILPITFSPERKTAIQAQLDAGQDPDFAQITKDAIAGNNGCRTLSSQIPSSFFDDNPAAELLKGAPGFPKK
jgi:hypothetical protein